MRRAVEWSKTLAGMWTMVAINIVSLVAVGYFIHEARSSRLDVEAKVAAWQSAEIYAPTLITVTPGPTMDTTMILESPSFDGGRILEDFPGEWIVRLRYVATDTLLCTMPQTGPQAAPYTTDSARDLEMSWRQYTNDDGSCFARMRPGQEYDLTTVREAYREINGVRVSRFLAPVRSLPFIFPGGAP
jgi:hypothetical protein